MMDKFEIALGCVFAATVSVLILVLCAAIWGSEIVGEGDPEGDTPQFEITFADGTTHKVIYYEHLNSPVDKPRYYKMLVWTPTGTQWMEYNHLNVVTVQKI